MKKSQTIVFRVTEKEYERIKKDAQKQGEQISSYARLRMQEDLTIKWVKKSEVQRGLSGIENALDKYEDRNNRVIETVRKEVEKLWNKI